MRAFGVSEQGHLGHARREADTLGRHYGFSEEDRGRMALVVTELGTNLIKHASQGEILLGISDSAKNTCIEIFAIDQGPGMRDVEACLVDGYSSAGSHGTGLGATRRQSTTFDVYSLPSPGPGSGLGSGSGGGTVVHARLCPGKNSYAPRHRTSWSVVARPLASEELSGDNFAVRETGGFFVGMVADGLGHGVFAAKASAEAVTAFEKGTSNDADVLAEYIHLGLKATRGAAIAVTSADFERGIVTYSGIGNIAGGLLNAGTLRKMVTQNGAAGVVARRIHGFDYPFGAGTLLIMHSDGIGTGWSLDKYPGLAQRDPALIAAVIYRDFNRVRDDALILVARLVP